jgi:hypothetical protein
MMVPQTLLSLNFLFPRFSPISMFHLLRATRAFVKLFILPLYIWMGMDSDIVTCVGIFKICGHNKPAQNHHCMMLSSDVASRLLEKLFVDFV